MRTVFLLLILAALCGWKPGLAQEEDGCTASGCHADLIQHRFVHEAASDDCEACHDAGDGDHPDDPGKEFTLSAARISELCFDCHDEIEDRLDNNPVVHQAIREAKQCISCHNPHSSPRRKLLRKALPTLCFTCHNGKPTDAASRPVRSPNLRYKILFAQSVHEPAADGDCLDCHEPHAAPRHDLLSENFPGGNYAPGKVNTFSLCFDCHDPEMIEEPTTREYTNFRDGDRNLHYVHVTREKGRSCRNCHDLHGSDQPHLIATEVPFGKWKMPIRYEASQQGGSCLPGCHERREYRR